MGIKIWAWSFMIGAGVMVALGFLAWLSEHYPDIHAIVIMGIFFGGIVLAARAFIKLHLETKQMERERDERRQRWHDPH